jgi:hypothetical protein
MEVMSPMKNIKVGKKLCFTKETIVNLNSKELSAAYGGGMEDVGIATRRCTVTICQTVCPSREIPCL